MVKVTDMLRVDELAAMVRVKMQYSKVTVDLPEDATDLKFCYDVLQHVSRSFAVVIIQLNEELRDAVCLFYLVLRALDTIEDDMAISVETKKRELPKFHEKCLLEDWHLDGIGYGKERELLEKFGCVARACQKLKKEYLDVIMDICVKMANGMCHFLENEVVDKKDYDMYCHYVAGLVGHGLTRLFAVSGLEDPHLADDLTIANSMGLFLQKCNIIRDYYEDIIEEPPRMFWPKDIWGTFADELAEFKDEKNRPRALGCLNAMVADALVHVPHCIDYMSSLKEPSVFTFCAIPQVMAIATLTEVYNNGNVFCDKVKIRKGEACKIILSCGDMQSVLRLFQQYANTLRAKLVEEDPSYDACAAGLNKADRRMAEAAEERGIQLQSSMARSYLTSFPALGGRLLYSIVDSASGMLTAKQ